MGSMLLTEQEQKVALLLAEVWNEYAKLPKEHPSEASDFCRAIHACQDIVLARTGRRQVNSGGV